MEVSEWEDILSPAGDGPTTMPLEDYVAQHLDEIRRTDDSRRDQPGWLLFDFARRMKGHPAMENLSAADAWQRIESVLLDEPADPFEHYFGMGADDAAGQFYAGWDRVKLPYGVKPLAAAKRRAELCPLMLPREIRAKRPPGYLKFIARVAWFQAIVGCRHFGLHREKVAQAWGGSAANVGNYARWAEEDGYLVKVSEAIPHVKTAQYYFDVSQFPAVHAEAGPGTAESFRVVKAASVSRNMAAGGQPQGDGDVFTPEAA